MFNLPIEALPFMVTVPELNFKDDTEQSEPITTDVPALMVTESVTFV